MPTSSPKYPVVVYVRTTVLVVAAAVAYYGLAALGRVFEYQHTGATIFWPAAGLALALVWRWGWRYVVAAFLGQLIYGFVYHRGLTISTLNALIVVLEVVVASVCLWRFNVALRLRRMRDMALFAVLAVGLATFLAALAGGVMLVLFSPVPAAAYWFVVGQWWLGDAMGVLIITPLVGEFGRRKPFFNTASAMYWLLITLATPIITVLIMRLSPSPAAVFFVLLPVAVVGAMVSGMRGATTVATVLAFCVLSFQWFDVTSLSVAIRLLFVTTSTITGYILAVAMAERRRSERDLRHEATHDALTGLSNRAAFDAALHAAVKTSGTHVLLFMDLDHFKLINDSRGHDLGDLFLTRLAGEFSFVVTPPGVLARIGGDEFAVIVHDVSAEQAQTLAEILRDCVQQFSLTHDGLIYRVGVSIGMALFSRSDTPTDVLSRADMACYAAKAEGGNHIHQSHAGDPNAKAHYLEIQRVAQLRVALADGRFRLARQLIAPIKGNEQDIPFYEMLLRVHNDDGAPISPGPFLDVATRYGLMPVVDRWVVEQSFRYLAASTTPMQLSINLFGTTLSDPALYDDIIALQKKYGVDSRRIVFEVTEQAAIQNLTRAIAMMNRFVDDGYRFSLDDFGSGVASFGYLQELPLGFVKIDGRFVRDIDLDPANEIIIDSLVKLSAVKDISCIAEWIENEKTLNKIRALGVDYGQGFYLHKPTVVEIN